MSAAEEETEAPVSAGDVLAGKYRVERVLGVGGMGIVVSATHLELGERVAVKFLLPSAAANPDAAARFLREARAAARIKSDYVARVIDVGRLDTGAPYMVMEYLDGCDLGAEVERGALAIEDAVDYVIQACHAMAEAHALGIVHRDLKPANLFLTQRSDGSRIVKVLDFGISKTAEIADQQLTKTSTMMGSPFYMSPEQMRSAKDVDHRTDIWALGVVLYQLLAGRPPFHGDTLPELLSRILTETPAALVSLRAEVKGELDAIAFRCLEKTPQARFDNVGELARALGPFGSRRGRFTVEGVLKITGVRPAIDPSLPPQAEAPDLSATAVVAPLAAAANAGTLGVQTATNWVDTRTPAPSANRTKWIVGGAALAGVVAALVFGLSRNEDDAAAAKAAVGSGSAPTLTEPPPVVVITAPEPASVAPPNAAPSAAPSPSVAVLPSAAAPVIDVAPAARPAPAAKRPATPVAEPPVPVAVPAPAVAKPPAEPPRAPPPPKKNPLSIELK